jgi:hypothetical protein
MSYLWVGRDWVRVSGLEDGGCWIEFAELRCTFCGATEPANGNASEHPSLAIDATRDGWQIVGHVAECPNCIRNSP